MFNSTRLVRWFAPVILLVAWVGIGGILGPYAGKLGEVATNDQAAFLPQNAESTKVIDAQKAFRQDETLPAIVVWTTVDGSEVTVGQRESATRALASLEGVPGTQGVATAAFPSKDGRALQGVVQLRPNLGDRLPVALEQVGKAAEQVPGTSVQIAGPAASQADLSGAFAGIDGLLLGVALATVLIILLLVYRSLILPLVIIISAVFALGLACGVVYMLADRDMVRVDGQVQGILSILVIGAATDYALLLSARFREELERHEHRVTAIRSAVRESAGPIVASAATVALGLIALLLSDLTNNRALGPVGAIGIVCAVLTTLTFLPRPSYCSAAAPTGRLARSRPEPLRRTAAVTEYGSGSRLWLIALPARYGASPSQGCSLVLRSRRPSNPRGSRSTNSSSTMHRPSPRRQCWENTFPGVRATRQLSSPTPTQLIAWLRRLLEPPA